VDYPVILDSAHADELQELIPRAERTARPGPAAWAEAVLRLLKRIQDETGPAA
jgi:hypothetical protein